MRRDGDGLGFLFRPWGGGDEFVPVGPVVDFTKKLTVVGSHSSFWFATFSMAVHGDDTVDAYIRPLIICQFFLDFISPVRIHVADRS